MPLFRNLYNTIPQPIRKLFRNRFTELLHNFLILRPDLVKSIVRGITIELTDKCNLRCSYCPKSHGIGVDGGDMEFAMFRDIVDQACNLAPIRQICLVGFGEPLLYPYLDQAIKYIKTKNPSIRVTITTNGILLNSNWAQRLMDAGLNQITISINATTKEQYQKINRADHYEKVVANTISFLNTLNSLSSSMRVLVQVLEGPNGPDEIMNFRAFWKPMLGRCGEIQVQPFVNWAGVIDVPGAHCDSEDSHYPCAHIQNSWLITREGNALACCMVFPGEQGDLTWEI